MIKLNCLLRSKKRFASSNGFTLIELIVAVGVFTVVSLIAVGSLLILLDAEERAYNIQVAQDNARYTLESMAREMRTGINYEQSGDPCFGDGSCLKFLNADGKNVVYRLGTDEKCKADTEGLSCIIKSVDSSSYYALTAPELFVDNLSIALSGVGLGDGFQPRVTIIISAHTTYSKGGETANVYVQTSISQIKLES